MRLRDRCLALVALTVVTGCAAPQQTRVYPPAAFDHRVATSQVEVYWTCSAPEAGVLGFEGVATNPWSPQEVRYLEVELTGLDASGRTVSAASGAVADALLRTNQTSPFRLALRRAGTETRFDLYYQYQYHEVEFESALWPSARPLSWATHRFVVRDACAPDQHRAR